MSHGEPLDHLQDIYDHLRTIASRGHTTDEDNQWLFDLADWVVDLKPYLEIANRAREAKLQIETKLDFVAGWNSCSDHILGSTT